MNLHGSLYQIKEAVLPPGKTQGHFYLLIKQYFLLASGVDD